MKKLKMYIGLALATCGGIVIVTSWVMLVPVLLQVWSLYVIPTVIGVAGIALTAIGVVLID